MDGYPVEDGRLLNSAFGYKTSPMAAFCLPAQAWNTGFFPVWRWVNWRILRYLKNANKCV